MLKKLFVAVLLLSTFAFAVDKATEAEIDHLLAYVKKTECKYIRNGTVHDGQEAAEHIKAKYDHYKDEIKTTEDFIRLSATQSLISGKKYYIECTGQEKMQSSQWLLEELKRFRSK